MKTSVIEVRDMLSVLSVLGVEKRIGEVPGVESVTVNYAARSATVRYDETRLEIADIKSHVRQSGYESVGEPVSKHVSEHNPERERAVESTPETAPNSTSAPVAAVPIAPAPAAPAADENKVQATPDAKPATPAAAAPKPPVATAAVSAPTASPADQEKGLAGSGALGKVGAWVQDAFGGEDKDQADPGAQSSADAAYVSREDVAKVVLWLCSEDARAVTGQTIPVR